MPGKLGRTALCLAGGGSRGIIQVGMMKAWRDSGLKYDMLFGTSVGALNGSLLHQGSLDTCEQLWLNIKNKDVYTWGNLWSPFSSGGHLYNSDPLQKTCDKYMDTAKIKSSDTPFYVSATNIDTQQPECKDLRTIPEDQMTLFIRASASPPIFFPPVLFPKNQGMMMVDGGLVNNFSVWSATQLGADTIIVFCPTKIAPKRPKNLLDMLNLATSIPEHEFLERELQFIDFVNKFQDPHPQLRHINWVLVRPPVPLDIGLVDFTYKGLDRKALIEGGYNLAVPALQKLMDQCL